MDNDFLQDLNKKLCALAALRSMRSDPAVSALETITLSAAYGDEAACDGFAAVYGAAIKNGKVLPLGDYLFNALAKDENPVSLAYLTGNSPSAALLARAKTEIGFLNELLKLTPENSSGFVSEKTLALLPEIKSGAPIDAEKLFKRWRENGCGVYSESPALKWNAGAVGTRVAPHVGAWSGAGGGISGGTLEPLYRTNAIRLSDLKEYAEEKAALTANTEAFLNGLPAANALLYGDRGTGKSSAVHALLNEYAPKGLRLIQFEGAAGGFARK
jgi:hypothetical protein